MALHSRRNQYMCGVFLLGSLSLRAEEPKKYLSFPVVKGDLSLKKEWKGELKSQERADMSARQEIIIKKILVQNGAKITLGQDLIECEPDKVQRELEEAQGNLRLGELELKNQRRELDQKQKALDRKKELFQKQIVSQKDLSQAENDFQVASTNLEAKLISIKKLVEAVDEKKKSLEGLTYRAIRAGVVSGMITPNPRSPNISAGTKLLTISNPDKLSFVTEVEEKYTAMLSVGQEVDITLDRFPDKSIKGKVTNVGLESQSDGGGMMKKYVLSVEVPVDPQYTEGLSGKALVLFGEKKDTLKIPSASLKYVSGEPTVFAAAMNNGKPESKKIKIGLQGDNEVEILSGLSPSEFVFVEQENN